MQAGDVVFFRPSGWLSRLVAKIDGGEFSHVAIAVSETHIAEAQYYTRSQITPLYGRDVFIMDLGLTEEQRHKLTHDAIAVTGKWYDFKLIVHYFITNALKMKPKAIWNSKNSLICSELVAGLLIEVNYIQAEGLTGKNISPRELFEHLSIGGKKDGLYPV